MVELTGTEFKRLPFDLKKRGDILYYEGPVLSHFADNRGREYLMNWVDLSKETSRWILFEVNKKDLLAYLKGEKSLRSLIFEDETGTVFFLDIDGNADHKKIINVSVDNIPNKYLPKEDAFLELVHAEEYADILIEAIRTKLSKIEKKSSLIAAIMDLSRSKSYMPKLIQMQEGIFSHNKSLIEV